MAGRPSKKRTIGKDELIDVMNNTTGGLVYINKRTQEEWYLDEYGAVEQMPLSELITMKSSQPKFLQEAWLVILNEEAVDYLGLTKLYKNILTPQQMGDFYKMSPEKMKEILEKAPNNMKLLIASLTKQKIDKKEFGDLFKIRLIESTLDIQLIES